MKKMTTKKIRDTVVAEMVQAMPKVTLPPSFVARINQMAHREGKMHADMWRTSTTGALKRMIDEGASLDELSKALAQIEIDPNGTLADGNKIRSETGE